MNNDNTIKLINENGKKKEYGRIPDLWHTSEFIRQITDSRVSQKQLDYIADEILQVWHMAHDLKAVVEGQQEAKLINE